MKTKRWWKRPLIVALERFASIPRGTGAVIGLVCLGITLIARFAFKVT